VTPSSAHRKLLHGVEHARRLLAEADAFTKADAYLFRTEVESQSPQEIRYRAVAIEQEAPPDGWPLLAGDAIQNLRSALDHAVYATSDGATRGR
jgi:hypothetical protein